MRCPLGWDQRGELVVGYAAETLDARAQAAFERHLRSCKACAEAASAQQVVWDALDKLMPAPCSRVCVKTTINRSLRSRLGFDGPAKSQRY
jgi:hypothetical protein